MKFIYKLLNGTDIIQKGGDNSIPKELSHIGTLWYFENGRKKYCCGCSYIGNGYVLTAAHCLLKKEKDKILIQFGSLRLDQLFMEYSVEEIIIHPNFNSKKHINDIAILKLDGLPEIESVKIPTYELLELLYKEKNMVSIYGFGKTGKNENVSYQLKKIELSLIDKKYTKYPSKICHKSMLFAKDIRKINKSKKRDTYQGDSGNGLIYTYNDTNFIVGIVSFGLKTFKPMYPGVYTKVVLFSNWINKIISS